MLLGALLLSGSLAASAQADGDQSYQALRDWIAASNPAPDSVTAGAHLTDKDRAPTLEQLIPPHCLEVLLLQ